MKKQKHCVTTRKTTQVMKSTIKQWNLCPPSLEWRKISITNTLNFPSLFLESRAIHLFKSFNKKQKYAVVSGYLSLRARLDCWWSFLPRQRQLNSGATFTSTWSPTTTKNPFVKHDTAYRAKLSCGLWSSSMEKAMLFVSKTAMANTSPPPTCPSCWASPGRKYCKQCLEISQTAGRWSGSLWETGLSLNLRAGAAVSCELTEGHRRGETRLLTMSLPLAQHKNGFFGISRRCKRLKTTPWWIICHPCLAFLQYPMMFLLLFRVIIIARDHPLSYRLCRLRGLRDWPWPSQCFQGCSRPQIIRFAFLFFSFLKTW